MDTGDEWGPAVLLCWALKGSLHEQGVEQGSGKMRSQAGSQGAESNSCNTSFPSLLLSAGDLGAQGLPRSSVLFSLHMLEFLIVFLL